MKIQNSLVSNILDRPQRYFAHVTTVTLSWRVQNIVVIGRIHFTLECFEFSSNFEFDRNMLSGTGAREVTLIQIWSACTKPQQNKTKIAKHVPHSCYIFLCIVYWYLHRADSMFALSQWETALQSNAVSNWLGANLESALFALCIHVPVLFWRYTIAQDERREQIWHTCITSRNHCVMS